MNLVTGQILSRRYRILSSLGEGGFGKTFLAEDSQLPGQQKCVVKQFKPLATDPATLRTARRLFDTEAKILHQLGIHPQIPQLFAYFEENQEFYLVQEYIEGKEISEELSVGKTKNEVEVIRFLQEILEILVFVHQQKVIHRDVNPRNLLRRQEDGQLILIDFGAVKQITTQMIQEGRVSTIAIGTPGYIPSEQAIGQPKFSSDIYAVGMIGIQALTGCFPHQIPTNSETGEIDWHSLAKVKVSPDLTHILERMTYYDFRHRYPSAIEALKALKALSHQEQKTVLISEIFSLVNQREKNRKFKLPWGKIFLLLAILTIGSGVLVSLNYFLMSNNAFNLSEKGHTLYELKRYNESLQSYEKALKNKPEYGDAWLGKGVTLTALNRNQDALVAYEKAIQIEPNNWEAWLSRAQVLEKLGKIEEAINSYQKTLDLKNDNGEALQGLIDLYLRKEQYAEATYYLEKLLKFQYNNPLVWYQKGWALQNQKEYKEAIKTYDRAVELKPNFSQAWYQKGNAFINLQQYQDAANAYEKAVQFEPQFSKAWYSQGIALSRLGRNEEAIQAFEQAIQAKPNYAEAWYQKGWILHQLKRYEEAISAYNQALNFYPSNRKIWYSKGNAFYNLAEYSSAISAYQKTVQLDKNNVPAWNSLGNALLKLNRYQEAINAYNQSLRYKSDNQAAKQGKEYAQQLLKKEQNNIIQETQPDSSTPQP